MAAVKKIPPLVASGGKLSVVYKVSSFIYGDWKVTWPSDYKNAPQLEKGRALGWLGTLDGPQPGRFARRWVKQDVAIDAVAGTSTVESVMDEVEAMTAGEATASQLIGPEGYYPMVPGVDFNLHDVVPVEVWGKVLNLPISSRKRKTTKDGFVEEVQAGGQLLQDRSAAARYNADRERRIQKDMTDLEKAMANESASRVEAVQAVKHSVSTLNGDMVSGFKAADANLATAREALSKQITQSIEQWQQQQQSLVDAITGRATSLDAQGRAVRNALKGPQQLAMSAQAAYNDLNSLQWLDQAKWNTQQQRINEALTAANNANSVAIATQGRIISDVDLRASAVFSLSREQKGVKPSQGVGAVMPVADWRVALFAHTNFRGQMLLQMAGSRGLASNLMETHALTWNQFERIPAPDDLTRRLADESGYVLRAYWALPLDFNADRLFVFVDKVGTIYG